MNKRLKRYTLNEEIIQKILKLMHKGEEAELTLLKRDYPNEYDVAEERLTDKLPDELQRKIKLDYPFPYTRDDCERFKISIMLDNLVYMRRPTKWKMVVSFFPIGKYKIRQGMPSLDITFSNICKAIGAGLPKFFTPDDMNTPFAGGRGPMTAGETNKLNSIDEDARDKRQALLAIQAVNPSVIRYKIPPPPKPRTGRLPFRGCEWVRRITFAPEFGGLDDDWLNKHCEDTKAAVIKAMREYNKRTKNKVRLTRAETLYSRNKKTKSFELYYEICKPVPALKKLVENRLKM